MNTIRLLLADPDPVFRDAFGAALSQQGYQVMPAASPDEMRSLLHESWFHLLILNIHLHDPHDANDTSGLEILHDTAFQAVPKIAIADQPTVDMTRKVLRPGSTGPMAVDFLGKEADLSSLLNAVQDALNKHVRLNNALTIRQQDTTSFLQLAQLIAPELSRQQLAERGDELESLFRRVFVEARQILLGRLLAHRAEYVLLEVTIYTNTSQTLFVSCGSVGQSAIGQTVPENIALVEYLSSDLTTHFVIQTYQLNFLKPLRTFGDLYSMSSPDGAVSLVQRVISQTFTRWHKSHRVFEPPDRIEALLQERLKLDTNSLGEVIADICQKSLAHGIARMTHSSRSLVFHLPDGYEIISPNPCVVIGRASLKHPTASIVCGLTHGAISGSSILLDANEQSWLMDWHRVERGPVLLDYAGLEMVIRLEELADTDLIYVLRFEQLLRGDLSEEDHQIPAHLMRSLSALKAVRQASMIDATAYAIGLLYAALASLAMYQPQIEYTPSELLSFAQMLLLAGLLSEQLVLPVALPPQALESLWIDLETQDVWVEGKQIELTSQDLLILVYLYRNAGQRRSREQIIDEALGDQAAQAMIEEGRLNSAMSRLRLKIEPDPDKPKYLRTIRGFGYRLVV